MSNPFSYRYQKNPPEGESSPKKESPKDEDTAGKTETFWTRYVKAITFFVCLAIFLAVFGPWSVFRIMDAIEQSRLEDRTMDVEDILYFAERRDALYFSQFEEYEGDLQEWEFGKYYAIKIKDTHLIMVGTEMADGRVNYFTVTHLSTNEVVDVMKEDFKPDALRDLLNKK